MRAVLLLLATQIALASCSDRYCSDPNICWANRDDIVKAADRCGISNFQPREIEGNVVPWVRGENPDTGPKTRCIIDDLHAQKLMVTH